MKLIGIDYGTRKTGIAISDDRGVIAFPYSVAPTDKNLVEYIAGIARKEGAEKIVLGESIGYGGRENPVTKDIHVIKGAIKNKTGLPVYLESEFYSSAEAKRLQGEHKKLDASAAALILQSFIDNSAQNAD